MREIPMEARRRLGAASRWLLPAAIAALLACSRSPAPPSAPPVQLVETVPVETRLGDPGLPSALDVWLEMFRGASRRIDLEQFYLSAWPGEPMDEVLEALGQAAARGVEVRLILDSRMHQTYPLPADSLAKVPGIEVRLLDMGRIAGGVQHAKFFLVDGEQVFIGSQNLDWRALKHIHELGVRIRDRRVAAVFREVFEMDWAAAGSTDTGTVRPPPAASAADVRADLPIRIVQAAGDTVTLWPSYSPKGFIPDSTLWDLERIVRLLDSARSEIVLQLLSYGVEDRGRRDDTLDRALRRAAARGVRVKLLISDWQADGPRIADLQSLSETPNIEAKLSVVPEWSGGYIPFARVEHCKVVVVDSSRTWIGTSNWSPSYFHGSRNLAVTLENRPLALRVRRIFETSWREPGALAVAAGVQYEPRVHGMTPPPGKRAYGE